MEQVLLMSENQNLDDVDEIDNEDDVNNDDNSDAENGNGDEKKGDGWAPPSKEEWERVQRAKAAAKQDAKKLRDELNKLKGGNNDGGGDSTVDVERARMDAEQAVTRKFVGIVGKQAAKAELVAQGLKGSPERLLKLIDYDDIEVSDDGDVSGIEEQVRQLKSEYPDLFQRERKVGGTSKDGSDKNPPGKKQLTATDRVLEQYGLL
jgi:hypothetical protein